MNVLTLIFQSSYNGGMKKQQEEILVELIGEVDLSRVPKDIFDAFLDALEEAIEDTGEET